MHTFYYPGRVGTPIDFGTEEITKQSHKAECDINTILKQFSQTGIIEHINSQQPQYLDLPENIDFQTSLQIISEAESAFASLPAKVRDFYQNDPGQFLAAFSDPTQREHLVELGIIQPPPAPIPDARGGSTPPSEGSNGK